MQSDTQSFTSIETPEHKDDFKQWRATRVVCFNMPLPDCLFPNVVASPAGLAVVVQQAIKFLARVTSQFPLK
jgi:hypothetical protein